MMYLIEIIIICAVLGIAMLIYNNNDNNNPLF